MTNVEKKNTKRVVSIDKQLYNIHIIHYNTVYNLYAIYIYLINGKYIYNFRF